MIAATVAAAADQREPEQLRLFEGGIDLSALRKERAELAELQRSDNTRRAYASDWRSFSAWCSAAGRASLPCSSDTLCLYCVSQARAGRAMATVERRVAAIASAHLAAGYASPLCPDVREVLAGCRRRFGTAPASKAALTVEELRLVLAACGDGVRGARDRAILLLGFASGCRRSELAALDVDDVTMCVAGLILWIAKSKSDQDGEGVELGIHRGTRPGTCPVAAVSAWLAVRGSWPGPLFCYVHSSTLALRKIRISGRCVASVLQEAAARAGLDASTLGAHSLRAGCATAASAAGAQTIEIMRRTRHKSLAMVERYVRHGSLFAVNPLASVL